MSATTVAGGVVLVILVVVLFYRIANEWNAKATHAEAAAIRAEEDALDAGTSPQEAAEIRQTVYDREISKPAPVTLTPAPAPVPAVPPMQAPPAVPTNTILHRLRYDYHQGYMLGSTTNTPWGSTRGVATAEDASRMCDIDPRFSGCAGFDYDAGTQTASFKNAITPSASWVAMSWLPAPSGAYVRKA